MALAVTAALTSAAALGIGVVVRASGSMPSISGGPLVDLGQTSWIYDRFGQPVTPVPGGAVHLTVPISAVPLSVQHGFVAVEDKRFYSNDGFDLRGILRAAVVDLTGHRLQGGSTITEQLAKNLYLNSTDTFTRKVKEAWLGLELARRYTKAEILDRYLNVIYLGDGAYGVQAASEAYFGVPVSRVDLPQAALLAGLAQAPSAYDPLVHPRAARDRRNLVLALMAQQNYITAAEARSAEAASLELAPPPAAGRSAQAAARSYPYPWFVDAVLAQLEGQDHISAAQLSHGGLRIYTTLDPHIQAAAQKAVQNLNILGGRFAPSARPVLQAAEAVVDPSNGDVVALVGGRRHTTMMGFDRALQAERQPGSSIKPLVDYIPALLDGMTAGTTVDDTVRSYGNGASTYTPTNYDKLYYGLTTFTEALRRSVNVVAVKVLNRVGVEAGLQNAVKMGLPLTQADNHLALALGGTTDCCTPLDMARAYATIANGGFRVRTRLITQVVAPDGQVLVSNPVHLTRVLPSPVTYVMTKMLETVDNPQPNHGWDVLSGPLDSNWGTGYDASVHDNVPGWPTAGKTGTSSNNEDAWYVGFTPKYAAAVWLGYDKARPFPSLFGGTYAGPVFRQTMSAAVAGLKPMHFARPAGVVQAPIDIKAAAWTVATPGPLTPAADIRDEWFVQGTQPTQPSPLWVRAAVMPSNPRVLWVPNCGGQPAIRTFLDRPIYGRAQAVAEARQLGITNWRSLIPLDGKMAPPTRTCDGTPARAAAAQAPAWLRRLLPGLVGGGGNGGGGNGGGSSTGGVGGGGAHGDGNGGGSSTGGIGGGGAYGGGNGGGSSTAGIGGGGAYGGGNGGGSSTGGIGGGGGVSSTAATTLVPAQGSGRPGAAAARRGRGWQILGGLRFFEGLPGSAGGAVPSPSGGGGIGQP